MIEQNLNKNILSDEYEYFFTFLSERFEYSVELWIRELEKKFNRKFKPIWVLSAKQNDFFKKENYIILNKKLCELKEKLSKNSIIYLQEYDELNKEFSESEFVLDLIFSLIKKQGRVFILPFTSYTLNFENSNVIILGPKPELIIKLDDKTTHINIFNKLNIAGNKTKIFYSFSEIKAKEKYPFYLSAAHTSGGKESIIVYNENDLDIFYSKLREINKTKPFLASNLISDIKLSPNVNAIVCGKEDTRIICITDQILRGNKYLGNIYPSKADNEEKQKIIDSTKKIGNFISQSGFRGLFGLDFIIDSNDNVYCVDLNPRRQGGYLCNILMSKKVSIPGIELNIALGEQVQEFDYEDFQVNYVWAHSKIMPYYSNMRIISCFNEGLPIYPFTSIGSEYKSIFYPANYLLVKGNAGYLIVSGRNYEEVLEKIIKETETIISENFVFSEQIIS